MSISIKDVAKMANVSVATVSLALNNRKGVKPETARRIREVAEKLHYRPNQNARSLKTDKSRMIGLIVPEIENPFYASVVENIRAESEANGHMMLLGICNQSSEKEQYYVLDFISRGVDSIIIAPNIQLENDYRHFYTLQDEGIPYTFITAKYEGIAANCVMTDIYDGSYQLVEYLLDAGYHKIFLISVDRRIMAAYLRINGYRDAYKKAGLEYKEDWIYTTLPDFKHGSDIAHQIVDLQPDAIITINDILSLGVLKFLKDKNIRVPGEIAVAGYDDILFASLAETPLTTVRQPIPQLCKKAVEIVLHPEEYKEPQTYYYKSTLVKRQST